MRWELEGPHIGNRGVIAADIPAEAIERADAFVHVLPWVVAFCLGEG